MRDVRPFLLGGGLGDVDEDDLVGADQPEGFPRELLGGEGWFPELGESEAELAVLELEETDLVLEAGLGGLELEDGQASAVSGQSQEQQSADRREQGGVEHRAQDAWTSH